MINSAKSGADGAAGKAVPALRYASCRLRPHSAPLHRQRLAVEFAARVLGQLHAQKDLLWRLECGKLRRTITYEIVGHEGFARTQYHIAHHLLAPHRVRNSDGRGLCDFGALHQDTVDLQRRDVDAAADDDVLFAPGEMQESVDVEVADVAGADAAATVHPYGAIGVKIAVLVVVPGADLDLAGFTLRLAASLRVHNGQPMVGERPADGTEAPIAARIEGDPGRLAAAIGLRHRNAEALLEAPPFGLR